MAQVATAVTNKPAWVSSSHSPETGSVPRVVGALQTTVTGGQITRQAVERRPFDRAQTCALLPSRSGPMSTLSEGKRSS